MLLLGQAQKELGLLAASKRRTPSSPSQKLADVLAAASAAANLDCSMTSRSLSGGLIPSQPECSPNQVPAWSSSQRLTACPDENSVQLTILAGDASQQTSTPAADVAAVTETAQNTMLAPTCPTEVFTGRPAGSLLHSRDEPYMVPSPFAALSAAASLDLDQASTTGGDIASIVGARTASKQGNLSNTGGLLQSVASSMYSLIAQAADPAVSELLPT